MDISSISGFRDIGANCSGRCRDVYFLRVKGLDAGRLLEIQQMDQALTEGMQAGEGFYYRGNQLPRLSGQEDAAYYSGCYENWRNAKGQGIGTKSIAPGSPLAQILGNAASEALGLLGQDKAGLSASIEKNFVAKLLFWLDQTVPEALRAWKPERPRKAVFGNICKKQEYLFCYVLTLLGFDVLLLQEGQDIDAASERLGLSKRIGIEAAGQLPLPEYAPSQFWRSQAREAAGSALRRQGQARGAAGGLSEEVQMGHRGLAPSARGRVEGKDRAGKAPAIVDVRIPERDRRTKEMLQLKPQQAAGNVRQPGGSQASRDFHQRNQQAVREQGQAWQQGTAWQGMARAGRRQELPYEELALLASSVVLILIHDAKGKVIGSGSGIMVGRDGYILTNSHVASGGRSYSVRIEEDERVYQTDEMIKYNSVLDLAILRIHRELTPIPIYQGREKLVRGQKVVAIGSPLGLFNSVSDGIISGFRVIDDVDMIQFTAPISHGSSGGAVLNMYGEVIGISTAGIDSGQNINLAVGYEYIRIFAQGFLKC